MNAAEHRVRARELMAEDVTLGMTTPGRLALVHAALAIAESLEELAAQRRATSQRTPAPNDFVRLR